MQGVDGCLQILLSSQADFRDVNNYCFFSRAQSHCQRLQGPKFDHRIMESSDLIIQ